MKNQSRLVFWFVLILMLLLTGCGDKGTSTSDGNPLESDRPLSDREALEAMGVIEERVIELRGLEAREPVKKAFMTTDALRQRIEEELAKDYSEKEAHDDVLLFVAFEFAERDLDLYNLLVDLQVEQVIGFYDPETDEMYVIKGGESPGPMERATFAHEYTHVLQDQHFDLEALGFTDEEKDQQEEEDSEQLFAIRSLVEGDASLLEQQYMLQHFGPDDIKELFDQINEIDSSVLDSVPVVLRETLLFPYSAGLVFVTGLYSKGGWSSVDAAYANPPLSSEQILHPSRYPDDVPQIVTLPPLTDTLGSGWRLLDEDVLGEFQLDLYLDVHVDADEAETAAEGWGGDRYAVYWREDESGFVLLLRHVWDSAADAAEFLQAYSRFAEDRFEGGPTRAEGNARRWWSGDDVLLLAQNGQSETLIIIAPDQATLEAVHALFPDF